MISDCYLWVKTIESCYRDALNFPFTFRTNVAADHTQSMMISSPLHIAVLLLSTSHIGPRLGAHTLLCLRNVVSLGRTTADLRLAVH